MQKCGVDLIIGDNCSKSQYGWRCKPCASEYISKKHMAKINSESMYVNSKYISRKHLCINKEDTKLLMMRCFLLWLTMFFQQRERYTF